MSDKNLKKTLTPQERAKAEKQEETRNKFILAGVLLLCLCGLVAVFMASTPEKQLNCDGSNGSLISFGSCR